ncbi:MAG: hypothetical protein II515_09595, partial [Desulfovibrio sp.]|nr:hypothetical protein [Desulfovibrio sp.]
NGEGASWGTAASSFMEWFAPWCRRLLRPENWQFIAVTALSLPLLARAVVKEKGSRFFCLFVLANLAYWFAFAPNLRFGNGFFYDMLAVAVFFNADLLAAPVRKLRGLALGRFGARLRAFLGKRSSCLALLIILLAAACVLSMPAVQDFFISLGGRLKGKELSAPHWRREFYKCVKCCVIVATALALFPAAFRRGRGSPFALACYALAVVFCCQIATKNRNLLVTIPVKAEVTERRLVNEEQGLYINVSTNNDLCGDAELPCTPEGSFRTSLRLFDKDDMGKGFYTAE